LKTEVGLVVCAHIQEKRTADASSLTPADIARVSSNQEIRDLSPFSDAGLCVIFVEFQVLNYYVLQGASPKNLGNWRPVFTVSSADELMTPESEYRFCAGAAPAAVMTLSLSPDRTLIKETV